MAGLFRRVRDRLLLEADLADWRWQARALRPPSRPVPAGRTVLFCDLMAMIATAKAQAVFAAALARHGWRPLVLVNRPDRLTRDYYRAAVPTAELVGLEERIDATMRARARDQAAAILEQAGDLGGLLAIERDGVRFGRNVLSWVTRRLRVGRPDLADPACRALTLETLARSLATAEAVGGLLDERRPGLALFNERGYTPSGEVFDACVARGIDAVQWLGAPQSDCLLFKRYTPANRASHPLALDPETWARLAAEPWTAADEAGILERLAANYASGAWFNRQQLQEGKAIRERAAVQAELGLDPAKKTAVIFAHILYDATFFFGDSVFPDYEAWLVEAVRGAIANPALNWVVKVHPVNVWRSRMDGRPMEQLEVQALRRAFGDLPPHVRIMPAETGINTFSLFGAIDYGLTVRGTIGMELPCFGIPVVTAGTGRYDGFGFTLDPRTPEEFHTLLACLHAMPPLDAETVTRARRYAHATFFRRPWRMQLLAIDYQANRFGLPALAANTWLDRQALRAGDPLAALAPLAAWLAERGDADLLDHPSAAQATTPAIPVAA